MKFKRSFYFPPQNKFFVPTLLRGEELYAQTGFFFVQSILVGRYIHRRELRLVSLESLSSVEYGIKKYLISFRFFTRSYWGLNFWENRVNSVDFIHIFRSYRQFSTTISPILLHFCEFFLKKFLLIFLLKTKNILGYFYLIFFLSKILAKCFKIPSSSSKTAQIKFI